jgi:hypothetical protein
MPTDRAALAAEAFAYGFPLVFNLTEVGRCLEKGFSSVPAAPFNTWAHATQLAGPQDTFVSINNDTIYSLAQIDVSGGPVRLRVPDAGGRYYVLQFVDAWTNNFAYVGHRATGTGAGTFLLVPPAWEGEPGAGERVIRLPTDVATIVGRWAVSGEEDVAPVRELQAALVLEASGEGTGLPAPGDAADDLQFLEQLRTWCRAFPPAPRDVEYQQRFAPLGLLDADGHFTEPDAELAAGLAQGRAEMEAALQAGVSPEQNGWNLTYHVFDYNLDFFEVGALDDPAWKLGDGPARYMERTLAARGGLWGNHGYEAAYAMVYRDGDGGRLDGRHRYELRFPAQPPVGAFWSVTMYDVPDFFLVDNPIGRYSIGDRTPGLVTDEDGGLTIVMQHDEPDDPGARANWLPAPAAPFRPLLRMYEPDPSVFDGRFVLPPIRRVDG